MELLNGCKTSEGQGSDCPTPFGMVPRSVLQELGPLPGKACAVYVAFCTYRDAKTGLAYPSRPTIAEQVRCSRSTVLRAITALKGRGLLVPTPWKGPKGTIKYWIPWTLVEEFPAVPAPTPPGGGSSGPPSSVSVDTQSENYSKNGFKQTKQQIDTCKAVLMEETSWNILSSPRKMEERAEKASAHFVKQGGTPDQIPELFKEALLEGSGNLAVYVEQRMLDPSPGF